VLLLEKSPSYLPEWRLNNSRAGLNTKGKKKILFQTKIKLRFQDQLSRNIVTKVTKKFWLLVEDAEEKRG
jgi:hypothetical protein